MLHNRFEKRFEKKPARHHRRKKAYRMFFFVFGIFVGVASALGGAYTLAKKLDPHFALRSHRVQQALSGNPWIPQAVKEKAGIPSHPSLALAQPKPYPKGFTSSKGLKKHTVSTVAHKHVAHKHLVAKKHKKKRKSSVALNQ